MYSSLFLIMLRASLGGDGEGGGAGGARITDNLVVRVLLEQQRNSAPTEKWA
jgi:hypothetical protein